MIKKTTNVALGIAVALLALACGGRAENQGIAAAGGAAATGGAPGIAVAGSSAAGSPNTEMVSAAGSGAGDPTPGVGPIDATGLPTQLPIVCADMTSPPQLALPCKVGGPLNGGADGPGTYNVLECYDLAGNTALSIVIPFGDLPTMLNRPVQIASLLPASPPGKGGLTGTLVFTQVDPVGRAFVAQLIGGAFGPMCKIPETSLWAVRGDFI